ncbi:EF-hand domain-containing protein [Denitrobaculum tricleocarpae]|nr:hypothetical protein [Denitrobaculum tricleocarpae]
MKRTTKLSVAGVSLVLVLGLAGAGLSNAHDRWSGYGGSKGGSVAYAHGQGGHFGGQRAKGRKMMRRMMQSFDANEDGSLTQAEIDTGRQQQLAQYDSDNDGTLSLEEFQVFWMEMNRSRMVDRFQRLDEDGDAIVTAGEFLEPFANAVERHDRNGDGVLSKDDRRKKGGRGQRNPDGDGAVAQ